MTEDQLLCKLIHHDLRDDLKAYRVLVTARPCPAIDLLCADEIIQRHVALSGFTANSRDAFLKSYGLLLYGSERWSCDIQGKLDALLVHLSSNDVEEMTYLPFISTLLVHALPTTIISELPKLETKLFCYLITSLLGRDVSSPTSSSACPIFKSLSESQVGALRSLASFAFRITCDQQLIFKGSYLVKEMSSNAAPELEEGALRTVCDRLTFSCLASDFGGVVGVEVRQFLHLLIQELLTAYHLLLLGCRTSPEYSTSFEESLEGFVASSAFGSSFSQVLPFLASLIPVNCAVRFFRCLTNNPYLALSMKSQERVHVRSVVLRCFHEWCLSLDGDNASVDDLKTRKCVANGLARFLRFQCWIHRSLDCKHSPAIVNYIKCAPDPLAYASGLCLHFCATFDSVLSTVFSRPQSIEYLSLEFSDSGKRPHLHELYKLISSSKRLKTLRIRFSDTSWISQPSQNHIIWSLLVNATTENHTVSNLLLNFGNNLVIGRVTLDTGFLNNMANLSRLYVDWPFVPTSFGPLIQLVGDNSRITHFALRSGQQFIFENPELNPLCSLFQSNRNLICVDLGFTRDYFSVPSVQATDTDWCWAVRQHPALQQFSFDTLQFAVKGSQLFEIVRILLCRRTVCDTKPYAKPLREVRIRMQEDLFDAEHDQLCRKIREELCLEDDCKIDLRRRCTRSKLSDGPVDSQFQPITLWHEVDDDVLPSCNAVRATSTLCANAPSNCQCDMSQ